MLQGLVAAAVALGAAIEPAYAQNEIVKNAERLSKKAMDDYDALEFDSARQTLLSAISKLRDAGLDETQAAARCYINLGIVYLAGFRDRNRGLQQFVNALKIDPSIQLDPERATPELQEAFDTAMRQVPGVRKGRGTILRGLQHSPVEEGRAGKDLLVTALLGAEVSASRIVLLYRSGAREDYVALPMIQSGSEWSATIPGDAVAGRAVQYYIEARDYRGRTIVTAGSASNPYIVSIARYNATTTESTPQLTDPSSEPPASSSPVRGWGRLFVNLMGGTAWAFAPSGTPTDVAHMAANGSAMEGSVTLNPGGFVFAPLHGALEVGVNITKRIGLSAMLRLGTLLGENTAESMCPTGPSAPPCTPGAIPGGTLKASGDTAVLARFRYSLLDGRWRPLVHLGLGGGQLIYTIELGTMYADTFIDTAKPPNRVCTATSCVDTVTIGSVFAAAGGGLYYEAFRFHNGNIGVLLDVDLLFALPLLNNDHFGIGIDLQLGIGVQFL